MVFVKKSTFLFCLFFSKKNQQEHFLIFWIENKAFWTSKVKFSQSRKKATFCKGVSPWSSSKNCPFSYMFFFLAKKARKKQFFCQKIDFFFISCFLSKERQNKHFLIFWIEKNAFKTTKKKF